MSSSKPAFKLNKYYKILIVICSMFFITIFIVAPYLESVKDKERQLKIRQYENIIKEGNATTDDYKWLGLLYYENKKYEHALICLNKAVEASETYSLGPSFYWHSGMALWLIGEKEEGLKIIGDYLYRDEVKKFLRANGIDEEEIKKGASDSYFKNINSYDEYKTVMDIVYASNRALEEKKNIEEELLELVKGKMKKVKRMPSQSTPISGYRTNKYYPERDQVFNALRDDINDSDMSKSDKVKASIKLHDDMYKE